MELSDILNQLKDEYVCGLPQTIEAIEKLVARQDLAAFREEFHKLRGTGKTYGLDEVSLLGAVVEDLCVYQPQRAAGQMKRAVNLLARIYEARKAKRGFNLSEDPDFIELKSITVRH